MGRTITGVSEAEAKEAASSVFKAYPAGEYIAKIIGTKKTTVANSGANKETPAINVELKFTEAGPGDAYVGKKFTAFRVPDAPKFASGKNAFLFFQFYKALGVSFAEDGGDTELPDYEDLWGEEIGVRLVQEQKEDGKGNVVEDDEGNPVMVNRVAAFFPASKGVKVTTTADDDETGFTL